MSFLRTPSASPERRTSTSSALAAGSPAHHLSPTRGLEAQAIRNSVSPPLATLPTPARPLYTQTKAVPQLRVIPSPTTPPSAFEQKPFKKDRSFRRAVVEKKLLTRNGLAPINEKAFIVKKTLDRKYNPHKLTIAKKGREWMNGLPDHDDDENPFVQNSNVVQNGGGPPSAASSSAGQRTSLSGSSRVHVPTARRIPPKGSTPLPYMRAGSHRAAVRLPPGIPSPPNLMAGPFKNSPLVRQTTDPWIPPSETSASSSNVTATVASNDVGVVEHSGLRASKTPPLDSPTKNHAPLQPPIAADVPVFDTGLVPPAIVGLSRKKTEPYVASSPAAPPFLASPMKHSAATVNGQPSRGNLSSKVPPQAEPPTKNHAPLQPSTASDISAFDTSLRPPAIVGLSRKKTEPYIASSPASPPFPASPMKLSAATVNGQPARGNLSSKVPPQATRLAQNKSISGAQPPSCISPPKASEPVLTPTTASGRVVPQTRQASNPGLRRQDTIYIPRTKDNGSQGSKENDGNKGQKDGEDGQSPAAPNDDDGDEDEDEQENRDNRSSNGEDEEDEEEEEEEEEEDDMYGEYDEHATFNDFFPNQKIELPSHLANFAPTQLYQAEPPADFEGDLADWIEAMYEGICHEVEILAEFAQHAKAHANNAYAQTGLTKKDLSQGKQLLELLEKDMRKLAGEEFFAYYQELLANGAGDPSDEDEPPLQFTFEDELRVNLKNRIVPREEANDGTYIVTPPLSEDDDANRPPASMPYTTPSARSTSSSSSEEEEGDMRMMLQVAIARAAAASPSSKAPLPLEKRKSPAVAQEALPTPVPALEPTAHVSTTAPPSSPPSNAPGLAKNNHQPSTSYSSSEEEEGDMRMMFPVAITRAAAASPSSKAPLPLEKCEFPSVVQEALSAPTPVLELTAHASSTSTQPSQPSNAHNLAENNHQLSPLVPEPPVVHGYKRAREDDSMDISMDGDSSKDVNKNKNTERRRDRPVKRMCFRAPSTSCSSDEETSENENKNIKEDTAAAEEKAPQASSSSIQSSEQEKEVAQVDAPRDERLMRTVLAPRSSFGTAIAAALAFFRHEEKPGVKKESVDEPTSSTQAQSSTERNPQPEAAPQPANPVPEHEVIDVDTYEYIEHTPQTNQAIPGSAQSRPFLLPHRRTIKPRPVYRGPNLPNNLWRSGSGNLNNMRASGSMDTVRHVDVYAGSGFGVQRKVERRATFGGLGQGASFGRM